MMQTGVGHASDDTLRTVLKTMRDRLDWMAEQPMEVLFPFTSGRKEGAPNSGMFLAFDMIKMMEAEMIRRDLDILTDLGTDWTALVEEVA
jgi:hypothetical protein